MTTFPKLGLPAKQRPPVAPATPKAASACVQELPHALWIYDIAAQELQRLGAGAAKAVVLEAVMVRILSDDALFRRIAIQMMRKQCLRRIKKIRRKMLDKEVKP
jgi:hypothetical protein